MANISSVPIRTRFGGRLTAAMGQPELAKDPRYVDHVSRGKNQIELDHRSTNGPRHDSGRTGGIDDRAFDPSRKNVSRARNARRPPFCRRDSIIDVETERWGTLKMQNAFPKLSHTPSRVRTPAPSEVGQHNAEIYGGLLAMDESEIAALKAADAI